MNYWLNIIKLDKNCEEAVILFKKHSGINDISYIVNHVGNSVAGKFILNNKDFCIFGGAAQNADYMAWIMLDCYYKGIIYNTMIKLNVALPFNCGVYLQHSMMWLKVAANPKIELAIPISEKDMEQIVLGEINKKDES